jgi:archaellin
MDQNGLQVAGMIIGYSSLKMQHPYLNSVIIPISLTAAGGSVDIRKMSVRYTYPGTIEESKPYEPLMHSFPQPGHWSVQDVLNGDEDHLLEPGEIFRINMTVMNAHGMYPNGRFTLEIKPAEGPELRIPLQVPPHIERINRIT